ncbi:unnamed protein product [Prunus armeniaca]
MLRMCPHCTSEPGKRKTSLSRANCSWLLCLGLKKPIMEEQVEVRRLGLQELVKMFQHEVVSHALIRKKVYRKNLPHNGW